MALKHLTDEQIQNYLDRNISKEDSWISSHVESCSSCKKHLKQYGQIYAALETSEQFKLSANFVDSVVSRVEESSPAFNLKIWHIITLVLGFIGGLTTAIYLTGINNIVILGGKVGEFGKVLLQQFAKISSYLPEINLNIGLFALAAFTLIFVLLLDRFVFQSKQRALSFFK